MLKKISIFTLITILFLFITASFLSWYSGSGIRVSDGRYLGYSANTGEWLFLQYQNIPVNQDGPYVFSLSGRRFAKNISSSDNASTKVTQSDITDHVEVIVDNALNTKFTVPLRSGYSRSELDINAPEKLLAISDLEGNFAATVKLLTTNGVINDSLNWTYGKGHLVLIGDMVDRGTNVVPLLWLIYKLEAEAQLAGGEIHYILGNHERYLLDGIVKSVAKKYYGTFRNTGMSQQQLWDETSELGRWLRSKPVMVKVGDTLFVHGGVSPVVLDSKPTLNSIDNEAKNGFVLGNTVRRNVEGSALHSAAGVLFYRGMAKDMSHYDLGAKASTEHVKQVLEHFQVNRVAIGHTLTEHIGHDYNGSVIRVDVDHSSNVNEALLIKNNKLWRVDTDGNNHQLEPVNNLTGE